MFNTIIFNSISCTVKIVFTSIVTNFKLFCNFLFLKSLKFIFRNVTIKSFYNTYIYKFWNYVIYQKKLIIFFIFIQKHCLSLYYFLKKKTIFCYNISKTILIFNLIVIFIIFIFNEIVSIFLTAFLYEKQNIKKLYLRGKKKIKSSFNFLLTLYSFYIELWLYKVTLLFIIYILNYEPAIAVLVNQYWSKFNWFIYDVINEILYRLCVPIIYIMLVCWDNSNYFQYSFPSEMCWTLNDLLIIPHWKYIIVEFTSFFINFMQILLTPFTPLIEEFYTFINTLTITIKKRKFFLFFEFWLNFTSNQVYLNERFNKCFFNSIWSYLIITTIFLNNVVSLTLILKTWDCSKSFNKYQFVLGFFYTVLNSWLILYDNNNLFLLTLVILTELTSVFLLTIILLNYMTEKRVKSNFSIWWLFLLIFNTTSITSYTYFNYYSSLPSQTNPLINFTYICYTTHSYILLIFIVNLTWLILLLLHKFKNQLVNYNILYLWGSTKTFINQIVDNLNILCEPFINKWNCKS